MKFRIALAALLAGCIAGPASAEDWANVKIKFVLDGTAPDLKPLPAKADPLCGVADVPNEKLVVNPANKGIANMVFMVDSKLTKLSDAQIHPDLKAVPTTPAVIDNLNCQFVPHVFHVRAGQVIDVKNSDKASHNAKFVFFNNDEWNQVIPPSGSKQLTPKKAETGPSKVECNIHPWMSAYHVVTDHPYVGISNADGVVTIDKLPVGAEITFKVWHESQNKFDAVMVNGKAESWKKGNVALKLKAGDNDLGTVSMKPDKFKAN